ncbi:methionine--tRNA ligase [Helicobacter anatolicus]|uniref:methionine--tRNA ligase n=1 Tax=Helicobacter anatolicus TaxID=2905874 RepID=UPI001E53AA45|nr:methionine--tRNA ligase [Helicobacter anatolicus]MCE3040229.1 methionine--tRNA ligase [Helicobacter anatolicus]
MKHLITTPIYYVNDVPHIGHAYTTILADMLKKYYQLLGDEVFLLTGTDEHGQKIEQSAQKKGETPKEYADFISKKFRDLWDEFGIDYDYFIRTTDKDHMLGVQKAFEVMYQKGDIYKGEYEGNYCVSCESFFTASQIQENKCPDCGRETNIIKEESYFFALSKYEEKLLQWYENNDCILPAFRKNEVINFVKNGLNDLSITRTSFAWGIGLPKSIEDPKHVVYVWLDALMNYVTAMGYGKDRRLADYWQDALHIVGKDILRFHAVYWPAFLLSLDLPLPKCIYAHGWWLIDSVKMSKSLGNVVDPKEIVNLFGEDSLRYFLLREVSFGQDGDFSKKALVNKINTDLANDLGNLINRVQGMAQKYFNLALCAKKEFLPQEIQIVEENLEKIPQLLQSMQPSKYLEELWKNFVLANVMIAKYEPWNLMKEGRVEETQGLLVGICNILIKSVLCLYPIMPKTSQKILSVFGLNPDAATYKNFVSNKEKILNIMLLKIDALFPKIEWQEEKKSSLGDVKKENNNNELKIKNDAKQEKVKEEHIIGIEDFAKIEMKIGRVVQVESIPKSKKLLKLQVDLGEGRLRQILSGIAEYYQAEDLLQKQVCILSNLKPAKIMGEISEGMILAVKDHEGLSLLSVDKQREDGSRVS